MMLILYNLLRSLYVFAIRLYASFNDKAGKWVDGRKDWEHRVIAALNAGDKRIWIHCSSVGEFEQARPVITALREQYPHYRIVVTFFSPSGYEACKNNREIDHIFYMPMDGRRNAEKFIDAINPSLAIFIKYEFWYHYLKQLKKKHIPTVLVSGAFREHQAFFKWYGGFFRKMLERFTFFFLQDEESKRLLNKIGFDKHIAVSGDTRYDRVAVIAQNRVAVEQIDRFKGDHKILIAGSTWPDDEAVIKECLQVLPPDWKLIIAPHEIHDTHIKSIQDLFSESHMLFSDLNETNTGSDKRILIINNIGMLSRLFAYADVAYIGGGFHKAGIHNILEPAVFGVPVIFGPVYEKFVEAKRLASLQYVFPVSNAAEGKKILTKLVTDQQYRNEISSSLKKFIRENTGATDTILNGIKIEKWLD